MLYYIQTVALRLEVKEQLEYWFERLEIQGCGRKPRFSKRKWPKIQLSLRLLQT
jgi:hypothetical protein